MVADKGKVKPLVTKEGDYFVNPFHPEVQHYELRIIEEIVSRYDFDAVVLDWVRCDDYNMDLSETTRHLFAKAYGFDPMTIDFAKANPKRSVWNRFRTQKIADYIGEVATHIRRIRPKIKVGVFILSPGWPETAQDPRKFAKYVDFLAPMCYYDDWGYPLSWIYDESRDDAILPLVRKMAASKEVVPVFDADWKRRIYRKLFGHLPELKRASFFAYGKWTPTMLKRLSEIR